jgi:hypothetical protein
LGRKIKFSQSSDGQTAENTDNRKKKKGWAERPAFNRRVALPNHLHPIFFSLTIHFLPLVLLRAVVQSRLNPDSADSFQFSFDGSPSTF